jgi:hypothetical protein
MKVSKLLTALASIAALSSISLSSSISLAGPNSPIDPGAEAASYSVKNVRLKCIHAGADAKGGDDVRFKAVVHIAGSGAPVETIIASKNNITDGRSVPISQHRLGMKGNGFMEFILTDDDSKDRPIILNMRAGTTKHITTNLQGSNSKYQLEYDVSRTDTGIGAGF